MKRTRPPRPEGVPAGRLPRGEREVFNLENSGYLVHNQAETMQNNNQSETAEYKPIKNIFFASIFFLCNT